MTGYLRAFALILALLMSACSTGGNDTATSPTHAPTVAAQAPATSTDSVPTAGPTEARATPTFVPTEPSVEESPAVTTAPRTATATPAAKAPTNSQDARFDSIAREVSRLRGLPIRSEIREDYLTRDQLRERLEKDLAEEYKPADVEADERVLAAFGLAPENIDLRKLYVDLYSGQISGLYDPETQRMYVISSGRKLNALGELTYAHEVTHALQDQHFDLEKLAEQAEKRDDDASLALQSLVEGDASVLQYGDYLRTNPDLRDDILQAIQEEQQDAQLPANVPPIIQETLTFPYEQGAIFVTTVRGGIQGSWKNVDAVYRDPPTSTEQILHPEKYLQARDEPTKVQVPDLAPTLGAGWKKLEENMFGEFQSRVLLEGQLDLGDAKNAAAGWDGDEFALYTRGEQEVVAWQTVWDSTRDAEEFAAALRYYDESRFGGEFSEQEGVYILSAKDQIAAVRQEADRVHYVLAPSQELATNVLGVLTK
ncbi:MAG: hypothetical protein M3Q29_01175 [Chloroflexota bacterium]|nr:hypothetical protein [Chloroflexota bacterium]